MITHTNYEDELVGESVAEVRSHWKGLFMFGAPDVMVVNVTKDAIWGRKAALPDGNATGSMDPRAMFPPGQPLPEKLRLPDPVRPREAQQEQFLRDMEIDPEDFYPPDANRDVATVWPDEGVEMDVLHYSWCSSLSRPPCADSISAREVRSDRRLPIAVGGECSTVHGRSGPADGFEPCLATRSSAVVCLWPSRCRHLEWSLQRNQQVYGIPENAMHAVGAAKVTLAGMLLAGHAEPRLVRPASIGLSMFMLGAIGLESVS